MDERVSGKEEEKKDEENALGSQLGDFQMSPKENRNEWKEAKIEDRREWKGKIRRQEKDACEQPDQNEELERQTSDARNAGPVLGRGEYEPRYDRSGEAVNHFVRVPEVGLEWPGRVKFSREKQRPKQDRNRAECRS